jgi:hypothetical protein
MMVMLDTDLLEKDPRVTNVQYKNIAEYMNIFFENALPFKAGQNAKITHHTTKVSWNMDHKITHINDDQYYALRCFKKDYLPYVKPIKEENMRKRTASQSAAAYPSTPTVALDKVIDLIGST